MPSAQEAREARRRKILARGSDRLAFIAGELPTISAPSVPLPSGSNSPGDDAPSSSIPSRSGDAALIRLIDASPSGSPQEVQELSSAEFDHSGSTRVIKTGHEDSRELQEAQEFPELEEVTNGDPGTLQANEDVQLAGLDQVLKQMATGSTKGGRVGTSWLTWDGIAYSIDFTKNYRAFGALVIAVISVLRSFLVYTDLEGKFVSKWAVPWPVALVLVTDISLVLGALLLGVVRTPMSINDVDASDVSTSQDQLGKLNGLSSQLDYGLEIGTVFLKTTQALFLDYSIYVVTLVSGYTLGQNLQSAR